MTDFKKIAADGFEINAKTLENNPDDAAARTYMLGVMMAKHLTEQHVQRAKRYVIDQMNLYLIFTVLILFVTIGFGQAYALEYTYPTINQRLTEIPTYLSLIHI